MILALDFGGTKLAAGLWDSESAIWVDQRQCDTPSEEGAEAVVRAMLGLGDALVAQAGQPPVAVGISFDGPVNPARGRTLRCHHVDGWDQIPLPDLVARHYGCPAAMDNDANLAAWAEQRAGAGTGCQDILYITVSTGVGGGLVLGSELFRGHQGLAGEIGHVCIDPDGPPCPCGRRGCLEAMAAGPAIVRWGRLYAVRQLPAGFTAESVHRAAVSGEEWAQRAMVRSAQALGMACAHAINLLNLECVVLGGGVIRAGQGYLDDVRRTAQEHVLPGIDVDIRRAALEGRAPLRGAALLGQTLL